jgi:hypothetical protein
MTQPQLLQATQAEFAASTAAGKYISPLPAGTGRIEQKLNTF